VFKSIIVPVDGSQPSNAAIDLAVSLSRDGGARLTLCHVLSIPRPVHDAGGFAREEMMDEETKAGHALLDEAQKRAAGQGVKAEKVLQSGSVADGVLAEAEQRKCDAIVMGSHGRGRVLRAVLGSASIEVIDRATVPIIIAPHAALH
jgi:nucleotide-binding universal stress UspA family protein